MVTLSKISIGGKSTSVNSEYSGNFQGLLNDLQSEGYQVNSLGGYNYRNIAGTNRLSKHALGDAIDINPSANPVTYGGAGNMVTDIPNASSLAQKWGLKWGGDFSGSKRDTMHFEVTDATNPLGSDASTSPSPEPMQYVPITSDTGDGSNMTGITSDGTASDGTLTLQSPWDQLSAADANGDGSVTGAELQAYNASRVGAKTAASIKAAGQGTPSDVPTAIVTAANQQALSQSDALKAIAAGAQAANEATNATNTGIWQGLQTWAGGRLLQIMVFILAAIFLAIGLYFFVPKNQLGIPA